MLVDVAQARIEEQSRDREAHDAKAMGFIATNLAAAGFLWWSATV